MDISSSYADYYIFMDGDEIYFTNPDLPNNNNDAILKLIEEGYTYCLTSFIILEKDFLHCSNDENNIWSTPHPFLLKNIPDNYIWPEIGDHPSIRQEMLDINKIYNTGEKTDPFKFDCKIKNFRRLFLREVFTPWHDDVNFTETIEEYADKNHHTVIWYRENIDKNLTLEEIIKMYNKHINSSNEEKFRWNKVYDNKLYYEYPLIIKQFIEFGKLEGIETTEDLKYLYQL
jgi:hypothetical protein